MKRVFSIQQFYTIQPNERLIDTRLEEVIYTEEKWRDEESQRLHRLYHVIMAHEKLLHEVLLYSVMREHDARSGEYGYFKEYYHTDISLLDICLMYKSLFHPSDQQWLADLRDRIVSSQEDDDPLLEIEPLEDAFRDGIKPAGLSVTGQ